MGLAPAWQEQTNEIERTDTWYGVATCKLNWLIDGESLILSRTSTDRQRYLNGEKIYHKVEGQDH